MNRDDLPPESIDIPDERYKLYLYWNQLPLKIELENEVAQKIVNQPIRAEIMKCISAGIVDEYCAKYNFPKRHALNAHELLECIELRTNKQTTIQNIHYHIKALIEENLLVPVATILEKRHKVTYYSRVAKMFLRKQLASYAEPDNMEVFYAPMSRKLASMHDDKSYKELLKIFQDYELKRLQFQENISLRWVDKNQELLDAYDTNLFYLVRFLNLFNFLDPDIHQFYKEMIKLLDLDNFYSENEEAKK